MKRYLATLWIIMAALGVTMMNGYAQTTTTIADGSNTNDYIPIAGRYSNGQQHQQVIYPGSMITDMTGSTISSMTFYLSSLPATPWNCTFSIRLGIIEETSFQNNVFFNTNNTLEVYSGVLNIDADLYQLTVNFTTPFSYSGGNLLLDVQNTTIGTQAVAKFLGVNSPNGAVNSFIIQGHFFGPNLQEFIPKTTFTYEGGSACLTPTGFTVVNVDATTATVSWQSRSSNAQYQVFCDTAGADLSQANWILTSDTFFTFNNLVPNAVQTAYVRSYCGGQASGYTSISFNTECEGGINVFPWTEGFEEDWTPSYAFGQQNTTPQCWRVYNGGTTEHTSGTGAFLWKINNNPQQVHSGQHSAVCYTEYAIGEHNDWLISPLMNLTGEQRVVFYAQNNMENTTLTEEISVWISDENLQLQAPENASEALSGFTQLFQTEIPVGGFKKFKVSLSGYSGNRYIAFVRRNSPNNGWYLCLDDVTVENIPFCEAPTDLSAAPSAGEAQLSWIVDADSLNLYYKTSESYSYSVIHGVSLGEEQTYILSGLNFGTTYDWYLEAICSDNSLMPSEIASFTTPCGTIASVPRLWDFEQGNMGGTANYPLPLCWNRVGSLTYPYIYNDPNASYSGNSCLYSGNQGAGMVAVLPEINTEVLPVNTLQIRFFAKTDGGLNADMEVGFMTDPMDATSFEPLQAINTLTENYEEYSVSFASVTTTARYIAIRMNPNDRIYIDDLVIEEIPVCARPTRIRISNITSNKAKISWSSAMETFNVYYQESGQGAYVLTGDSPVRDTSYLLSNLNPNTTYNVYISSLCHEGMEMASSVVSFTTDCIALDSVPYTWDFESNNTAGTPSYPMQVCWKKLGVASSSLYVSNYSPMAYGGSHSLYSVYPNNYIVVLPVIDTQALSLDTLQLSLYAKTNYGRSALLEVGTIADANDASTFVSLSTFHLTSFYQKFETSFLQNNNIVSHLAFRMKSETDYVVIDDVTLEVAPRCVKPTTIECISLSSNSVTLRWVAGADEENWTVVYGERGFNPDEAQNSVQTTSNSVVIDSLLQGSSYDFYVRANCGEDGVSGWLGIYDIVPGYYNMKVHGRDSIYTCDATIFDDGGANGEYSGDCNSYLVVFPSEDNSFVEISGTLKAENCRWDYLVVYDGTDTEHEMYRSNQETNTMITIPTITSHSGPLTIYFHSDNSVSDDGFVIYTTCVSCVAPRMTIKSVGLDNAVLFVDRSYMGNNTCEIVYGPRGFDPDGVQPINLNHDTTYTITGLTINTAYDIYIRAYCGGEMNYSNWSHVNTFSTLSFTPATMPYSCNFENGEENAFWTIENGNQTNRWYINGAVNNTVNGDSALYISDDNGTTNSYQTEGAASFVWAYRDIQFTDGEEFVLSFDWNCYGEGYSYNLYDYLSVYVGQPSMVEAGSGEVPQNAALLGQLYKKQTWSTAQYVLGSEYSNKIERLYFLWKNDNGDGTNPPAAIDNIVIKPINCAKPVDSISIANITDTSATITIVPTDDNAIAWQLRYGNNSVVTISDSDTYVLDHLAPATQYEVDVRSICNNGDTSLWTSPRIFVTSCYPITASSLPYLCGFETDNFGGTSEYPLPVCWNRPANSNDYPAVVNVGENAYEGVHCLQSGYNPVNSIVVLPEIDTAEVQISSLMLSFQALMDCYSDYTFTLEIGVMSNPDEPSTFVPVNAVSTLSFDYSAFEMPLSTYTGAGTYIAFRFNATGGIDINGHYAYANIFIDNVVLDYTPTCRKPDNLVNLETTSTSVKIGWTPEGDESAWEVKEGPLGFNPEVEGIMFNSNNNELIINNLQQQTAYDFYVRAHCGEDSYSVWSGPLTVVPGSYNMKASGIDTLYTCEKMIYDNGGPFADYSDRSDAYLVIYPDGPNRVLEVSGTILADDYFFDYLVIYDGAGIDENLGEELYYSHQEEGVQTTIPPVISSTGPLTLYFHSDYTITYAGFELAVTCVSCITPSVSVSSIFLDSAVVSWTTPIQTANDFELVYGPSGFNPNTATAIPVSGRRSYSLTGLTVNTSYDVYVRTNCGSEYSAWSEVCRFNTLPSMPASVPYACDFENATETSQWTIINGNQTNKWYLQTLGNESTVLYVSCDNGATNTYVNTTPSSVWAYRDMFFPDNADFVLSFDWLCQGEVMSSIMYDYVEVLIGDPVDVNAGSEDIPESLVSLGKFNMEDSWTRSMVPINREYASGVKRLFFLWRNDNMYGDNPAAVVDNINIEAIFCAQPVSVDISEISSNSAHVVVTSADANMSGWQLMYDNNVVTIMNDTVTDLTNLHSATAYNLYVRSICDNGDTSLWYSVPSFVTTCGLIGSSSLPYVCDFENNNFGGTEFYTLPACWQRYGHSDYPYVERYSYDAHQGEYYLSSGMDATDFFVVLPEINTSELSVNELQLAFYAKLNDFSGRIDVGVMTDPSSPSTFTPLGTVSTLTEDYVEYEVSLAYYSGNGSYIAFRLNSVGGHDYYGNPMYALIYIDDVTLDYIPDCQQPAALNQNNISALSADLSWSNVTDFYKVYYREVGAANYTVIDSVTLTNGVFTLNNLSPLTSYEWYVASICVNGSVIPSHTTGTFTTLCEVVGTFPYQESFENGLGCWISTVLAGGQDCQWQIQNTYGAYQSPINPADGNSFAEAFYYGSGSITRLSSPAFDLSSLQEPYIKFYHVQLNWGSDQDYLKIYYKTSGTAEPVLLVSYDNSIYPWRLDSLALPNPSANYQLLFDAHLNYGYGVGVDKVVVYDHYQGGEQPPVVELPVVITDTATQITEHSAVLNGTIIDFGNQNITARGFEWKLTSGGTYSQVADAGTASSMTYPLTELTDNTSYTYRAFVSTSDTTVFGAEVEFVTLEEIVVVPCETPANLQVSNVSATTAEITWTAGGEEDTWVVEHKLQTANEWHTQSVNTTQVIFENLALGSTYMVRVKAVCGEEESDFVSTSFTTSVGVEELKDWSHSIVLMPNPAEDHIELYVNSIVKIDKVDIYNAMGQWIQTEQLQHQHARINLENMTSGIYFVRVYSDSTVVTKKFIKK